MLSGPLLSQAALNRPMVSERVKYHVSHAAQSMFTLKLISGVCEVVVIEVAGFGSAHQISPPASSIGRRRWKYSIVWTVHCCALSYRKAAFSFAIYQTLTDYTPFLVY